MRITDERFYTEEVLATYPGLEGIADTYKNEGVAAAEARLAAAVRKDFRIDAFSDGKPVPKKDADIAEAEEVVKGNVSSVGFRYQFPNGKIMWAENPTYNKYKEWTWQLSRHHVWKALAVAYRETGDERYAETFVSQFFDWTDQVPCPDKGVSGYATECWRTIEAGIRTAFFWPFSFATFYKTPAASDHFIATYMKSLVENAERLIDALTSHNWIIMEMSGLATIGMLSPWLAHAKEWLDFAIDRLITEYETQFYPDGFQYELSTGYQGIHIDNYKAVFELAKKLDVRLPETFMKGYERVFGMYTKIVYPDGRTPALNDGHRAAVGEQLAIGLKYFPGREDFRWFATDRKEGKAPNVGSVALPYAGMAMMRTGLDNEKDVCLFFESAPFGVAHQHEDKLNVLMYAYGKEVLPDTGNYPYDTSEMRRFAIGTRSHNTGMVDDRDQNRRATYKWNPDDIKKRSDLHFGFTDGYDTAEGVYDEGYGAEHIPVTHKRKVIFMKSCVVGATPFAVVIDRMAAGDGEKHRLAVHYQMNRLPFTVFDHDFTLDCGDGVKLDLLCSEKPEIILGQSDPYLFGWKPNHEVTGKEPRHYPAPAVRMKVSDKESYRFGSVLYPTKDAAPFVTGITLPSDVADTTFTLTFADGTEKTFDEKDFPCDDIEK